MKKLIFFSLFMIISICAFSQDVITTISGEKISCRITGIDSTNVYVSVVRNGNELTSYINKFSVKDIQYGVNQDVNPIQADKMTYYKNCITIGILQGGGSLFGVDFEFPLADRFGIQAGAGFIGFGGGLNYHFKPTIRSSFISLQYWHQGVGDSYTQSLLGPSFVYRGKKWFTAQIGLGFLLENGPAWPEDTETVPLMLTYSIGVYIVR